MWWTAPPPRDALCPRSACVSHTQHENMRWILKQQRLEDEAKEDEARPKIHKALASRWVSRRGCIDAIFFPDASSLPLILCQPSADPEEEKAPAVCQVTGAPAKYKDPLTGFPYADAAAFRELRRRHGHPVRRRRTGQQEREANADTGAGPASAGTGAAGGRGDSGAVSGAVDGGAGDGNHGGAAGASGSAAAKPAPGDHQGGHSGGGQGKRQGSSRDGERKTKSAAAKGRGKAGGRSSSKGGASSKVESSKAVAPAKGESSKVVTPSEPKSSKTAGPAKSDSAKSDSAKGDSAKGDSAKGDSAKGDSAKGDSAKVVDPASGGAAGGGAGEEVPVRVKAEGKEKPAAKRPRKLSNSAKAGKPARRPFFAPAPAPATGVPAAAASPPAAGSVVALGPVKPLRRDEAWVGQHATVPNAPGAGSSPHGTSLPQGGVGMSGGGGPVRSPPLTGPGAAGHDTAATNGSNRHSPPGSGDDGHRTVPRNWEGAHITAENSSHVGWQQPMEDSPPPEQPLG